MMKSLTIAALAVIAALAMTTSGQVKSVAAVNNHTITKPSAPPKQTPVNSTRSRVLNQAPRAASPKGNVAGSATLPSHARPDLNSNSDLVRLRTTDTTGAAAAPLVLGNRSRIGHTVLKPAGLTNTDAPRSRSVTGVSPVAAPTAASSQIYRVGVRDVLDIQLPHQPGKSSTLFTVNEGGLLEYPLVGNPVPVAGLTTPEIAALLRQRLRVLDNPAVIVSVRDYASHTVNITGFVAAPGTKILRREAMPLYAILAEALVLPDAGGATIIRPGRAPFVVDLKAANLSSIMVISGDTIKVSGLPAGPAEFFFIGGEISSPGQKPYHVGLTLTQAIFASGGTNTNAASKIKISRQGADGLLTTKEYNLRKIHTGKVPDPLLQKGDRIEVTK